MEITSRNDSCAKQLSILPLRSGMLWELKPTTSGGPQVMLIIFVADMPKILENENKSPIFLPRWNVYNE